MASEKVQCAFIKQILKKLDSDRTFFNIKAYDKAVAVILNGKKLNETKKPTLNFHSK